MTFQLDTTGAFHRPTGTAVRGNPEDTVITWAALSPFTQGYIEALFAATVDPRGRMMMPRDGRYASAPRERRKVGFSDLAPETLARIIADCDLFQSSPAHDRGGDRKAKGKAFWEARMMAPSVFAPKFPPLTVQLGDDGKVRFAERG